MDKNQEIRKIITEVNRTLGYFDPSYVFAKRFVDGERECCIEFDQYIECRFNMEFSKIPEFAELFKNTLGHVFSCKLINGNPTKRRFESAVIEIVDPDLFEGSDETLKAEIESIRNWLGGDIICFTDKKKKFVYKIKNRENE